MSEDVLPAVPRLQPLVSVMDLIGTKYVRGGVTPETGFDCFTLLAYVRWHWFARPTPIHAPFPRRSLTVGLSCALMIRRVLRAPVRNTQSAWMRCEPQEGCAVALSQTRLGPMHHCGVWIGGGVLHAVMGSGVVYTPGTRLETLFPRAEFYECRG
jgi:hypothetical protein